jgi:thioredoxin reductase
VTKIIIKKYQDKSLESKKDTGRGKDDKKRNQINVTGNNEGNSEDQNGSMQQEDEKNELPVRFLVTAGIRDIDQEIFHIIHENGLVYNGRLIVKNNFQTTDPAIFACGKICEFSQRYKHYAVGKSLRLDKYVSTTP